MQLAVVAAGFTPGEADGCAARWRRGEAQRRPGAFRAAPDPGHARARLCARIRRAHLPADPRLRRIRFSRIACGELRAAGLCLRLAQVPRARRVPRRALEQPADGLLCALAAGAGRAPPRRRSAAGGRARERLGVHAGALCRRCARRAPGIAHGERPVRGRGRAHRVGARRRLLFGGRTDAPRASRSTRTQMPRGERRTRTHCGPPAARLLAGRRRGQRAAPAVGGPDR